MTDKNNGLNVKSLIVVLAASGGMGTTTSLVASNAVTNSEARSIAKETAEEMIQSDVTTDKIQEVIEESPVIINIQKKVDDNTETLEEIQKQQREDTRAILDAIREGRDE